MDEVYSKLVSDEIELEEKNAQLEQSLQFIFSLLSAMGDVLLACNQDGVIEETNAALCALVGQSDEALRGTPVLDLLADAASEQRWREAAAHTASGEGAALEIDLRDAGGRVVAWSRWTCSARPGATAPGGRWAVYWWGAWWRAWRTNSIIRSASF